MSQILVYTKQQDTMDVLRLYLAQEQIRLMAAATAGAVREALRFQDTDLLLVESALETPEDFYEIRQIRQEINIPVLVLSEKQEEQMVILALNAGADDYVKKPFHVLELVARIKAQIRRYAQLSNLRENLDKIYRVDGLEIDDSKRKVTVDGREVRLTPIEYKILKLLVQQQGRVLSIAQIYETIWNMQAVGVDNTIAVHIRHIREKIEQNPKKPQYLKVIWGTGYKVG